MAAGDGDTVVFSSRGRKDVGKGRGRSKRGVVTSNWLSQRTGGLESRQKAHDSTVGVPQALGAL